MDVMNSSKVAKVMILLVDKQNVVSHWSGDQVGLKVQQHSIEYGQTRRPSRLGAMSCQGDRKHRIEYGFDVLLDHLETLNQIFVLDSYGQTKRDGFICV
jgi:carbamate kinase